MPNWTFNQVTCSKKVMEAMTIGKRVSFNNLIPMSETLDMESGSSTYPCIYYYVSNRFEKKPNSRNKYLKERFEHKYYDIGRVKQFIEQSHLTNDEIYDLGKQYCDNFDKYGAFTWYEWRIVNWGCKWDASESSIMINGDKYLLSFSTPWCEPEAYYEKLCAMFPDEQIEFHAEYEEGLIVNHSNENGVFVLTQEYETIFDDEEEVE